MNYLERCKSLYKTYKRLFNLLISLVVVITLVVFYFLCVRMQATETNNADNVDVVPIGEVIDGDVVTQQFTADHNIKSLSLLVGTYERNNSAEYNLELKDESGKILVSRKISTQAVANNQFLNFEFGKTISGDSAYTLSIQAVDATKGNGITFYSFANEGSALRLNDVEVNNQTLLINCNYYVNRTLDILPIILILLALLILLYFLHNKGYAIQLFFSILIIGGSFALYVPVFDSPDESAHYMKSVMTSYGIAMNGDYQNKSIPAHYSEFFVNNQKRVFSETFMESESQTDVAITKDTAAAITVYPFFGFVPQTVAMLTQRTLGLSDQIGFYLGRMLNVLAYALLCFAAVKITPKLKMFIGFICLSPGLLIVSSSFNQDATTYGMFFLTIAFFIKLYTEQKPVEKKELYIFTTLCTLLSVLKYNFLPLFLLFLCLPKTKFVDVKDKLRSFLIHSCICIGFVGFWYLFVSSRFSEYRMPGVSTPQQLSFLLHNIPSAIVIMCSSVFINFSEQFMQTFSLGYYSYKVLDSVALFYLIFLVYSCFRHNDFGHILKRNDKWMVGFIAIATLLLTNAILYLTWTEVAGIKAMGVQGRYLLPLVVFFPFLLVGNKKDSMKKGSIFEPVMIPILFLAMSLVTIVVQYY